MWGWASLLLGSTILFGIVAPFLPSPAAWLGTGISAILLAVVLAVRWAQRRGIRRRFVELQADGGRVFAVEQSEDGHVWTAGVLVDETERVRLLGASGGDWAAPKPVRIARAPDGSLRMSAQSGERLIRAVSDSFVFQSTRSTNDLLEERLLASS